MPPGDTPLARKGAILVKSAFEGYRSTFRRITRASQAHFEQEAWRDVQRDMRARLAVYSDAVRAVVVALREAFGADAGDAAVSTSALRDDALWSAMKEEFSSLMRGRVDLELAETFFNSVTRKVFTTVGVRGDREFVDAEETPLAGARSVPARTYPGLGGEGFGRFASRTIGHHILEDCAFAVPYADLDGDARLVSLEIEKAVAAAWPFAPSAFDFVEMLEPVFYRGKGAYLVGRVVRGERALPLIVALKCHEGRIWVDAALLSELEASIVFSFTRSYFHVDVDAPAPMIGFLKELMPRKRVSELYAGLGYERHAKTELYRDLYRHLGASTDRFERARGEKGLVMLVFTMAGFDIVIKVLRDDFGPTKTVTREGVHERYRFVSQRDRAGRLVDTQPFEHLAFGIDRFEPSLLEELLREASTDVAVNGDQVILRHVYTERRVVPLNLYVREAPPDAAREAVVDFGRAIRDLGASNIFPGDMLLKNFGVTRSGRVVFYDYDELCLLSDVDFRELPSRDDDEHTSAGEASFYVGPRDVFPEEFIHFFGLPRELRELFIRVHGDLLRPAWWNEMKARHAAGEIIDVYPYREARRLHGRGRD